MDWRICLVFPQISADIDLEGRARGILSRASVHVKIFTAFAERETVWDVMKEFMFFIVFDFAGNAEETIPAWQLDEVKSNKRDYSGSTKRQNETPLCCMRFVISIKCC